MFRFESPLWLFLLWLPPLLAWLWFRRPVAVIAVSSLRAASAIRPTFFARTRWLPYALKAVALALMIVALARPQWGTRETTRLTEGINIVLAVDLSESMSALDFELDGKRVMRVDAVKSVVKKFIEKRGGDRIGLVVFGSEAYTQMPLTNDYSAITQVIDRVGIGSAGKTTAIGDAIGISLKRLQDLKSKSNIIILITDGQSNSGEIDPETATGIAASLGVKVYTIGVGTEGAAPFMVDDPLWGRRVIYQKVDIDEGALKKIASATGGQYFHASQSDSLMNIYDTIDRMEKTEVRIKTFDNYNDLYLWPLVPAFALLALSAALANTRYMEVP